MEIRICKDPAQLGASAAKHVAQVIRQCIAEKGCARIALSTGASQFDTIRELVRQDVDWSKVDKEDYLLAMERSPIRDIEIKHVLKAALTDDIHSREMYMKGIDHSYYYEGYTTYKTEEL